MDIVGKKVKELREKRGLSQLDLAETLEINNSVLSRIESGKRPVEDVLVIKFADFFNVTSDYLLGRSTHPELTREQDIIISKKTYELIDAIEKLPQEVRETIEKSVYLYSELSKKHKN
ncbi:helix-turn-helix transcriptional regulator [Bacillus sp. RG28]|uniref:Helix-turn-helix transcriptional regulator n=1 Tax=Gottfriedia endophytica TaxID=2820819 RepID=A0A940SK33_9BACI|nr:helix-turn-helix transcriptional regulator [Gottfriedia endophytica]MBP0725569.1 helix-turn-helix transcriptional regulator [Gottfriedia endophytica]